VSQWEGHAVGKFGGSCCPGAHCGGTCCAESIVPVGTPVADTFVTGPIRVPGRRAETRTVIILKAGSAETPSDVRASSRAQPLQESDWTVWRIEAS